jgi:integrase
MGLTPYASLLIQQGESVAFIKQQLGHASIQTTVDICGHLVPGESRAGIERLPNVGKRNPNATDDSVAIPDSHVSS